MRSHLDLQTPLCTLEDDVFLREASPRVQARGRLLFCGTEKYSVRGVTYGPFGEVGSEYEYGAPSRVERDFAAMAPLNINTIRTYTVPPVWMLDLAQQAGLRVMAGIPWAQHVSFLDDRTLTRAIISGVRAAIKDCAGHPALLCYAIGNEIPASIVRWHGAYRVERFLRELYWYAKDEDPEGLFTYVNYPSTEYLQLPFLDIVCFNVYLESTARLAEYLARLLSLAGERPLLMGEIGLDSRRNGEEKQARLLSDQIGIAFRAGCAGAFVFSWTDQWRRGGYEIEDWDFGLVRRDRTPKLALQAVRRAFDTERFGEANAWPRVSVVICTYNGQRYIAQTLSALNEIEYPNYEVIVIDDGSTDATAAIADQYGARVIRTANSGLSAARNTGLDAATGEIVAYIDDDAYPEREWIKRLATLFLNSDYAGIGGPNLPPPGDSLVEECVAHAPGGPIHVLLSDTEAEHIPGCNMAFRRERLLAIGGFDPQFRIAGDDVDICWRIQEQGWKLGFCPTATVFHHRRGTLSAYWKQQSGYGKAEALLERKWPGKYNAAGHLTWGGRVYNARGLTPLWWRRGRIYQGTWGTAPYQRLYQPTVTLLGDLPLLPEWYLVIAFLATLSVIGSVWPPLLAAIPLLAAAVGSSVLQAAVNAAIASSCSTSKRKKTDWTALGIGIVLHLTHPLARLHGRLKYGLHPWRQRGAGGALLPRMRTIAVWSEEWHSVEEWMGRLQGRIREQGMIALAGGDYDRWDLEVQGGMLGGARTQMAVEEHGGGRQLLRFRIWPRCSAYGVFTAAFLACLAFAAGADHAWVARAVLGGLSLLSGWRIFRECGLAMRKTVETVNDLRTPARSSKSMARAAASSAGMFDELH